MFCLSQSHQPPSGCAIPGSSADRTGGQPALEAAGGRAVVLCARAGYGTSGHARRWLGGGRMTWCAPPGGAARLAAVPEDTIVAIENYHLFDGIDPLVERLLAETSARI